MVGSKREGVVFVCKIDVDAEIVLLTEISLGS